MATNVGKNLDILRRQRKKDGCFGRFFAFELRGFVRKQIKTSFILC